MIKTVAVIPARGGSKGIPGKNLYPLNGKPLIDYTIECALQSKSINHIYVSTDSHQIRSHVENNFPVDVLIRPENLAQDSSRICDTIKYHLLVDKLSDIYQNFVLLEPTSPLRTSDLIEQSLNQLTSVTSISSVASFTEVDIPPSRTWYLNNNQVTAYDSSISPWKPRQEHNTTYRLNGLIYAFKIDQFLRIENSSSILPEPIWPIVTEASISTDIDSLHDLKFIEYLINSKS